VSGGDTFEPAVDLVEERAELDVLVAEDVGARGPAGFQLGDRVADNPIPVGPLQRSHLERNVQPSADRSREPEILLPGTGPEVGELVLEPDLEIEGGHVVPLLPQQTQSDGAIDAARNQCRDSHDRPRFQPSRSSGGGS